MGFAQQSVNGVKWTFLSTVINAVVKVLQISILTRILAVSDFGLVAIATLFIGFTDIFLDMGLTSAVLHKQDISRKQYSSLFWFNVISGLVINIIFIALCPLFASFYKEKGLSEILILLSLNITLSSVSRLQRTVQQKELNFKVLSLVEIIGSFLMLFAAVFFAFLDMGVFSLVYSTLLNGVFIALVYSVIAVRTRFIDFSHFSLYEIRPFFKIGVFQVGSSVLDYFSREMDIIIISASFGPEILGLYSLCKQLVLRVYNMVNPILTKVFTPLMAQLQGNIKDLREKYMGLIEILSNINFPIYFLIASFSYYILYFLYGSEYTRGSLLLSILAVNYGLMSIGNPVGALQIALGRTDIGFYWTIYRIVSMLGVLLLGRTLTIEGLVILILVVNILNIIPAWYLLLFRMIKLKLSEYLKVQYLPFIIGIIFFTINFTIQKSDIDPILILPLLIVVGVLYPFISIRISKKEYYKLLLLKLKKYPL